jgi:hypothetical protein
MFFKTLEIYMKLLAFLTLFVTSYAYSQSASIALTARKSLSVTCPIGNVLELTGNVLKCVCPKDTFAHLEGDQLKCDSLCEIKEEVVQEVQEGCDQGGCYTYSKTSKKVLTVKNKTGKLLYQEQIYSPRASEFEALLNEALTVAKRECFQAIYKDNFIK